MLVGPRTEVPFFALLNHNPLKKGAEGQKVKEYAESVSQYKERC